MYSFIYIYMCVYFYIYIYIHICIIYLYSLYIIFHDIHISWLVFLQKKTKKKHHWCRMAINSGLAGAGLSRAPGRGKIGERSLHHGSFLLDVYLIGTHIHIHKRSHKITYIYIYNYHMKMYVYTHISNQCDF